MQPRRKPVPAPIARAQGNVRALVPTRVRAVLPTAAALALALAGVACSGAEPDGSVLPDRVSHVKTSSSASATTAPTTSTSSGAIDPTPVPLPGEAAIVVPPPPPSAPPHAAGGGLRPFVPAAPSSEPIKTAGKIAPVHTKTI